MFNVAGVLISGQPWNKMTLFDFDGPFDSGTEAKFGDCALQAAMCVLFL